MTKRKIDFEQDERARLGRSGERISSSDATLLPNGRPRAQDSFPEQDRRHRDAPILHKREHLEIARREAIRLEEEKRITRVALAAKRAERRKHKIMSRPAKTNQTASIEQPQPTVGGGQALQKIGRENRLVQVVVRSRSSDPGSKP